LHHYVNAIDVCTSCILTTSNQVDDDDAVFEGNSLKAAILTTKMVKYDNGIDVIL